MAAACEFDRLIKRNVPHILEKIFLSLDSKSFMNCFEVSKNWNVMLTSESFQRKGKSIFCEDLQGELCKAAEEGNSDELRKILSSGLVDINCMNEMKRMPLSLAAENGHKYVVQIVLDRGAEPNMADQNGRTPLSWALLKGHTYAAKILKDNGGIV